MTRTNQQILNIIEIFPQCMDDKSVRAFAATGFILPCCWCDSKRIEEDFGQLIQDHLHIDNVESIEDIELSDEWLNFFRMLKHNPEDAPPTCKHYCGKKDSATKSTITF